MLLRVAKGYTLPEIGVQLGLSRHTIADYVKQIYRKLNVSSRAEAALEAQRLGLFRRLPDNASMIGRITGPLAEKTPPQISRRRRRRRLRGRRADEHVLQPARRSASAVALLTHFVVREDAQQLFGFLTAPERDDLPAAGQDQPASARAPRWRSCRASAVDELSQAVARQDGGRLVKVPGIGKKTAERLLLELKGKLGARPGAAGDRRQRRRRPTSCRR